MGFFLHIEVDASLTPAEFEERIVTPICEALKKENLGRVLDSDGSENEPGKRYELALEVTDQQRAREVVQVIVGPWDDDAGGDKE